MKLIPISAGSFHCDGGALFSVIPKKLWSKVYPVSDDNFTKLSLRCLLIDTGDTKILIEAGIGNHYSEKHFQNNGYVTGNYLVNSLEENGYKTDDITDVFFTHLHWDHFTGAVKNENRTLKAVFPNARYWCSKKQWEHSKISNPRERAAYNDGVLHFMYDSGKLNLVEEEGSLFPGIDVHFYDGHTPGQMIPFINYHGHTIVYMADLIPTSANIPLLWMASYDLYPVVSMEEKEKFLNQAVDDGYILFFEHDYYNECASLEKTIKGFQAKELFQLQKLQQL